MPREYCPICTRELHSIITRRVGNFAVCIDCGDTLGKLVTEIADEIVRRSIGAYSHKYGNIQDIAVLELDENFRKLVSNPDNLRALLT